MPVQSTLLSRAYRPIRDIDILLALGVNNTFFKRYFKHKTYNNFEIISVFYLNVYKQTEAIKDAPRTALFIF